MTLGLMTLSIIAEHSYKDLSFMLTVTYAQCHIKAPYAERRYAECHYAECHGALQITVVNERSKLPNDYSLTQAPGGMMHLAKP